jgi:preprotein translocase subunit YajC
MKLISIVLSFALLFTGCYTHTTVTKDTPNVEDKTLIFQLTNGSRIVARAGQHHRIEEGYKIVYNSEDVEILLDEQIKEVVVREADAGTSVLVAVVIPLALVGLAFGIGVATMDWN